MQKPAGKWLRIMGAVLAVLMILAGMVYPLGQYGSGWSSRALHVDTLVFSQLFIVGWLLLLAVAGAGRMARLMVAWIAFWCAALLFSLASILAGGGSGGLKSLLAFIFLVPLAGLDQPGALPAGLTYIGVPILMVALGAGMLLLLRHQEKTGPKA